MATNATGGKCVVCGKMCDTRCGSCAEKGLKWMYFCNREHQKLIWPVHRRVCGISTTFRWPGFSDREAKEVHQALRSLDPVRYAELVRAVDPSATDPEAVMESYMQVLRADRDDELDEVFKHSVRNSSIASYRHLIYASKDKQSPFKSICAQDPIGCLITWENKYWKTLSLSSEAWIPNLQHRLIIVFAILGRVNESQAGPDDDLIKYFLHAAKEALQAVSVIKTSQSEEKSAFMVELANLPMVVLGQPRLE